MKHAGAKPSRKKLAKADRALFLQAAEALTQAAMTDEKHRHSGESDRLLRIASDVARHAAQPGSTCDLRTRRLTWPPASIRRGWCPAMRSQAHAPACWQ